MRYRPTDGCSQKCNGSSVIVAAIDVGTNTTRLLVADVEGGRITALAAGDEMTALGEGLDSTGRIARAGLDRVERVAQSMAARARALGAERMVIACTAVGRDAANAPDLLARLSRATGTTPRVLTGGEEARLTFAGLVATREPSGELVAADLGGGSLELMGGRGDQLLWATSLPVGARKLSERFGVTDPPGKGTWDLIAADVAERVSPIAGDHAASALVVAGGSAQALATLAGTARLDADAFHRVATALEGMTAEELAASAGIEVARVRLCCAGGAALDGVRTAFRLTSLEVSTAGLREGLVLEATS
jgi:exopolyphosphatase/guanosine-5'-triphosphate,3'-diphosphate pyrophosphatase